MKTTNKYFYVFLAFFSLQQAIAAEDLSQESFLNITNSTFEFVIPLAYDAPNITYDRPLSYDKLPHYIRKDKLLSVGTAFAIDPKHIVTAAHILDLNKTPGYLKNIRLRDPSGALYEIDSITKFSQLEDYAVFTLKTYPANMSYLKTDVTPKVGSTVHAVGNALGQGIIERSGRVTSFTDEEMEGKWKYIRFTAPASPGNSGGPLVNNKGLVVGVVVKKSNDENLNYAVPINLIEKDNGAKGVFYDRSVGEVESGERLLTTWTYSLPLPQNMLAFSKAATDAFVQSLFDRRAEFEKQFKNKIFPTDKAIAPYLRYQTTNSSFVIMDKNTSGVWGGGYYEKFTQSKVTEDQTLYYRFANDNTAQLDGEVYLEKPEKLKLHDFLKSPKLYFDTFLKVFSFKATLAGEVFTITSLGEPYKTNHWEDVYHRHWISSYWKLAPLDTVISTHCLPIPVGIACRVRAHPTWSVDSIEYFERKEAHRTTMGYFGKLKEWKEFLALPDTMKPRSLRTLNINMADKAIENKEYALKLKVPESLSNDSNLEIEFKHALDLQSEDLAALSITPKEKNSFFYATKRIYDAIPENTEEVRKNKKEVFGKVPPYDGSLQESNESYFTKFVEADPKPFPNVKSVILYNCFSDKDKNKDDVKKQCEAFKKLN